MDSHMLLGSNDLATFFFFNDTATTEIYTLSLHDALPISRGSEARAGKTVARREIAGAEAAVGRSETRRSEEHTSELQSHSDLVCRLLLEKKKKLLGDKNIASASQEQDAYERDEPKEQSSQ